MIQDAAWSEVRNEARTAVGRPGFSVTQEMELILRPSSEPGALEQIRELLRQQGIKVLAASPYSDGQSRQWLAVVNDGRSATAILREAGLECVTDSVLVVEAPMQPAYVAFVGAELQGEGIGIQYAYVSATGNGRVRAVFKTTDEARALEVLAGSALPDQQPRRYQQ